MARTWGSIIITIIITRRASARTHALRLCVDHALFIDKKGVTTEEFIQDFPGYHPRPYFPLASLVARRLIGVLAMSPHQFGSR